MKYSVTLEGEHRREKLVLASQSSESAWHITLKLLGYLLYYQDRPAIERSVDWHYKPDLVAMNGHGVDLWIDCGVIGVKKIERVSAWLKPEARFVILRSQHRDAHHLLNSLGGRLKAGRRLTMHWFDNGAAHDLADRLDSANTLQWARDGDTLHVRLANRGGEYAWQSAVHTRHVGGGAG